MQGFNLDSSRPRGKWQVSTDGGTGPRWRHDGKELYYYGAKGLMVVEVKTDGTSFDAGIPKPLFDVDIPPSGRNHFLVTMDGQRFLVIAPVEDTSNSPMQVLVNWR